MKRSAKALWNGDLKTGYGELTTDSSVLNKTQYSFNTRFADSIGTNPEELLAASHSGCFTMALAYALSQKGTPANELQTTATVNLDMAVGGITAVELNLDAASIEGVAEETFLQIANDAKLNCVISKVLAGVSISLNINYGVQAPIV